MLHFFDVADLKEDLSLAFKMLGDFVSDGDAPVRVDHFLQSPEERPGLLGDEFSSTCQVSAWFLDHFSARRAFIYVLEIIPDHPLVAFAAYLPPYFAFIDSQAGEAALKKGYGKDDAINAILTAVRALAVRSSCDPDPSTESSPRRTSPTRCQGRLGVRLFRATHLHGARTRQRRPRLRHRPGGDRPPRCGQHLLGLRRP